MKHPDQTQETTNRTSRSLIDRIQNGQRESWEEFVDLYSPLVYYWCRQAGLPEREIPDLFQEIFTTVSQKVGTFRVQERGGSFRGWLRTVTRNKIIDHQRRQHRNLPPVGGTEAQMRLEQIPFRDSESLIHSSSCERIHDIGAKPSDSPKTRIDSDRTTTEQDPVFVADSTFGYLFQDVIQRIRTQFRDNTWSAFWGVVVEDRPVADVAEHLGMKPGAVRVAKSRVLNRFRVEMGDLPGDSVRHQG